MFLRRCAFCLKFPTGWLERSFISRVFAGAGSTGAARSSSLRRSATTAWRGRSRGTPLAAETIFVRGRRVVVFRRRCCASAARGMAAAGFSPARIRAALAMSHARLEAALAGSGDGIWGRFASVLAEELLERSAGSSSSWRKPERDAESAGASGKDMERAS